MHCAGIPPRSKLATRFDEKCNNTPAGVRARLRGGTVPTSTFVWRLKVQYFATIVFY
jgi:hypothetical protein